ncbi:MULTISPECIES: hypothetical protein [unclassified Pseudomonas]|uniref:hypothetical protein n=1 Tax=unclassified Pseudomonas TaxID=196821 RepID=UPI0011EF58C5|nr:MULTISPECIES: hypothetical protein [unclassified Pseudomonas]KAA0944619.1 hypothetical protein FQ182_20665 [Pseudomonas sp. ANT_H4]KAA0951253.1 hypothetical protein FQ186_16890 [Pseudomonas sp. ANT_H14]
MQLSSSDQELFVNELQKKVTFIGNKIHWATLQNPISLSTLEKDSALTETSKRLSSLTIQNVIFLGDAAIDHAYSINITDIKKAIEIFSEVPQHTYIFPENLCWIGCLAFEGYMDYADLQ